MKKEIKQLLCALCAVLVIVFAVSTLPLSALPSSAESEGIYTYTDTDGKVTQLVLNYCAKILLFLYPKYWLL